MLEALSEYYWLLWAAALGLALWMLRRRRVQAKAHPTAHLPKPSELFVLREQGLALIPPATLSMPPDEVMQAVVQRRYSRYANLLLTGINPATGEEVNRLVLHFPLEEGDTLNWGKYLAHQRRKTQMKRGRGFSGFPADLEYWASAGVLPFELSGRG